MCGIFGSKSFEQFDELYKINQTRGDFASGHLFVNERGDYEIDKRPGSVTYDIRTIPHVGTELAYDMYMGHTQSPTGSVRDYRYDTSHPFQSSNWIVAHNGVLNNHQSIIDEYFPDHDCDVDSSVIPAFLEYLLRNKPVKGNYELMDNVVSAVLNRLSGTYAVFIYNKPNKQLYIARCGSTLFYNPDECTFSSVKHDKMESVPECTLYKRVEDRFVKVCNLQNNSSFMIF